MQGPAEMRHLCHIFMFPDAGFPYEILSMGHFVPNLQRFECPRYRGKEVWKQIMTVADESCVVYGKRVISSFNAQVGADATAKAKAREVSLSLKAPGRKRPSLTRSSTRT